MLNINFFKYKLLLNKILQFSLVRILFLKKKKILKLIKIRKKYILFLENFYLGF